MALSVSMTLFSLKCTTYHNTSRTFRIYNYSLLLLQTNARPDCICFVKFFCVPIKGYNLFVVYSVFASSTANLQTKLVLSFLRKIFMLYDIVSYYYGWIDNICHCNQKSYNDSWRTLKKMNAFWNFEICQICHWVYIFLMQLLPTYQKFHFEMSEKVFIPCW